jgi:xanthine/uracil permease
MNTRLDVHPVDEKLPLGKLSLLGIQHVLVMYARALAVPLIIGFGMIPLVADKFFVQMPKVLGPLLGSGILLASLVAVALNLFFNQLKASDSAAVEATDASLASEA